MNKQQSVLKKCAWVSLGALLALMILSVLFFKERLLFADTAFASFELLNSESLLLLGHRYGAVVTKLLPCLLIHLHVPVIPILMSYLLSYNLFYLLVVSILFDRKCILLSPCRPQHRHWLSISTIGYHPIFRR